MSQTQDNPIASAAPAHEVLKLWNKELPGPGHQTEGQEKDFTKASDRLIAGKRIIKLGNVSSPEIHVFHAPEKIRTGTSVLICPGGGFSILAWDLEGTEIATWLNSLGITAAVLKYRCPTRKQSEPWKCPVQDTQRALRLIRTNAKSWGLDGNRVGVLGFSAGGNTAAIASYGEQAHYPAADETDKQDFRPNFSVLIYAAWLVDDQGKLNSNLRINEKSPPAFIAHAFDDFVPVENCLELMKALKKSNVPSELHIYDRGGHGYGLRDDKANPVTTWNDRLAEWLRIRGLLKK